MVEGFKKVNEPLIRMLCAYLNLCATIRPPYAKTSGGKNATNILQLCLPDRPQQWDGRSECHELRIINVNNY